MAFLPCTQMHACLYACVHAHTHTHPTYKCKEENSMRNKEQDTMNGPKPYFHKAANDII